MRLEADSASLAVRTLPHVPWMDIPGVRAVVWALGRNRVRFVGGCVRDHLIGRSSLDVDMATDHPPQETLNLLRDAHIRVEPIGIEHGTVVAITDSGQFQITTLREDVQTDGRHAVVYDGVEACLEKLQQHGCKLAVVTNKPEQFVAPLLEQMGLDHWFDLAVGGDTLPVKKPDPAPLLHAMETLGGTRGTTVMVGDSAADVDAALAAGVPCVAVRYGYNFGKPVETLGADAVVDSLAELL